MDGDIDREDGVKQTEPTPMLPVQYNDHTEELTEKDGHTINNMPSKSEPTPKIQEHDTQEIPDTKTKKESRLSALEDGQQTELPVGHTSGATGASPTFPDEASFERDNVEHRRRGAHHPNGDGHHRRRSGKSWESREKRQANEMFEYFWNKKSVFSQWYPAEFSIDGIDFTFTCAEQYMMYKKAELFGDTDAMEVIQALTDPKEMKHLGRHVTDINIKIWKEISMDIVRDGNVAKFSQNEKLKEKLICTYPKVLAEASPYDTIWGIGLAEDWPDAFQEKTWKGLNLLGYILTDIRNELMKKDGIIDKEGVIPVDWNGLKQRYIASEVNDDDEIDVKGRVCSEEQLGSVAGGDTSTRPADGGKDGVKEMKTTPYEVKEMDIDDNRGPLNLV